MNPQKPKLQLARQFAPDEIVGYWSAITVKRTIGSDIKITGFIRTYVYRVAMDFDDFETTGQFGIARDNGQPSKLVRFIHESDDPLGRRRPMLGYNRNGGAVLVAIVSSDGYRSIGVSICSKSDKFDPRRGYKIALKRAVKGIIRNSDDLQVVGPDEIRSDLLRHSIGNIGESISTRIFIPANSEVLVEYIQ